MYGRFGKTLNFPKKYCMRKSWLASGVCLVILMNTKLAVYHLSKRTATNQLSRFINNKPCCCIDENCMIMSYCLVTFTELEYNSPEWSVLNKVK